MIASALSSRPGELVELALTEEQRQLQATVREFAEQEILPHVMDWDERSHFPRELIPKLGALGLLGIVLPESLGGLLHLTQLDLRNNQLLELPAALGHAANLAHLDLRGNKLQTLPASLAALPQLEKLDLRWNKLRGEQAWLRELERRGCIVLR